MAFGVFDVNMQFLSRKKPIFCDFWPFLVIFEFELMPAGASLWSIYNEFSSYPRGKQNFFLAGKQIGTECGWEITFFLKTVEDRDEKTFFEDSIPLLF